MKLPVNPDVVRVCIKFYAYLKKVQVEALKTLIRFKKEVKEYVRLIAPWLARPVQESLRLPYLIERKPWFVEGIEKAFKEHFRPVFDPPPRSAPLITPFGTPVFFSGNGVASWA